MVENGAASNVTGAAVTGDFFRVIGAGPILGRVLNRADDVVGAENVLVITHRLWQSRYGGSRDVIGRRVIVANGRSRSSASCRRTSSARTASQAWMTLAASASTMANPGHDAQCLRDVDLIARLRPGATIEQARSELAGLTTRLDADSAPDAVRGWTPVVHSYEEVVVGAVRPALLLLFGAVGLVLLIASANAATLLLLRGEARRPELAVRAALGAGPGRLARQLLAESLLLALAAGAVGLVADVVDAPRFPGSRSRRPAARRLRADRPDRAPLCCRGCVSHRRPGRDRACALPGSRGSRRASSHRRTRRDRERVATRPRRARHGPGRPRRHGRGRGRPPDAQPDAPASRRHGAGRGPSRARAARSAAGEVRGRRPSPPAPRRERPSARVRAGHRRGDARPHSALRRHRRLGRARVHGRGPDRGAGGGTTRR